MHMQSPSSDARKAYAIGIGICTIVLLVFAIFAATLPTYAANGSFGLEDAAPAALKSQSTIPVIIGRIISAALSIVGIVFLFLMIFAGLRWMTARGNQTHAEAAKDTILRAVIGLIIVAGAYAITSFVISRITAATDTGSSSSSSSGTAVTTVPCDSSADCGGKACIEVEPEVKFCASN